MSDSLGARDIWPSVAVEHFIGGSLAKETRKHQVKSGKCARLPYRRLWPDDGLGRRSVWKRSIV